MSVPIFERLWEFKQRILDRLREQRSAKRYLVRQKFPLIVTIRSLSPGRLEGASGMSDGNSEWKGSLHDVCSNGVGVRLPVGVRVNRGHKTTLSIPLDGRVLLLAGVVAHFEEFADHTFCGLYFPFDDVEAERTYLILLEAVKLGASLVRIEPTQSGGLVIEEFMGEPKTKLTVWREGGSKVINSFELLMGELCFRGEVGKTALEIFAPGKSGNGIKAARSIAGFALVGGDNPASYRLFCWVVPNLYETVSPDLRFFLQRFLNENPAPVGKLPHPGDRR